MLCYASDLLVQSRIHGSLSSKLLNEIRIANHSISRFAESLTFQFPQRKERPMPDPDGVKSMLITASASAHVAVVQLNSILAQTDPDALGRQRNACKNALLAAREMVKLTDQYFPQVFCVALAPVYKFLITGARGQDGEQNAAHTRADINILLRTLERLKRCMPLESAVPLIQIWQNPLTA